MCGIAGFLFRPGKDRPDAARPLIEAIKHRGPNGIRVENGPGWSIGHARLSIIDLEGGWQPLHGADGAIVIGNGEIYNYLELKAEFALEGQLKTGSDFEPLLALYPKLGEAVFDRLRGMYGLCLLDASGDAFLVRDPFGIKPLYYLETPEGLAFASELRALLPLRDKTGLNDKAFTQVAAFNYAIEDETVFAGICRLVPGEILKIFQGQIVGRRLRPAFTPNLQNAPWVRRVDQAVAVMGLNRSACDEAVLDALDKVFEETIVVHQRADVPYGLFLSGGIDSASIATMMARVNSRPVVAYTCGFAVEGAKDERAQAERLAKSLKLDWHNVTFTHEDFWRLLPKVAWAFDEPTTDYATLPTFLLAEAAKDTLTVVLSGEGGDELFGGYSRYRKAMRPKIFGGKPSEPKGISAALAPHARQMALGTWREVARRARGGQGRLLGGLLGGQLADMATWLPSDLLLKLDRCLMANGLEGRTPFLDPAMAAFAARLPDSQKVSGRYGKVILRHWLERHCPAAEPWARKSGFTVPVADFIAPQAGRLAETLPVVLKDAPGLVPDQIRQVFTDEALKNHRWGLLSLGLWWLIHQEGEVPTKALSRLIS